MNVTFFVCNISSAILQSKLLFLFPFGLVIEKIGLWFKHETIMRTMIWELIQRCGDNVPSKRHWMFQLGFAWDVMVRYLWDVVTTFLCDMCRCTTETSWQRTIETSLGVSFRTSLRSRGDIPMACRCYVLLRRCHDVP